MRLGNYVIIPTRRAERTANFANASSLYGIPERFHVRERESRTIRTKAGGIRRGERPYCDAASGCGRFGPAYGRRGGGKTEAAVGSTKMVGGGNSCASGRGRAGQQLALSADDRAPRRDADGFRSG